MNWSVCRPLGIAAVLVCCVLARAQNPRPLFEEEPAGTGQEATGSADLAKQIIEKMNQRHYRLSGISSLEAVYEVATDGQHLVDVEVMCNVEAGSTSVQFETPDGKEQQTEALGELMSSAFIESLLIGGLDAEGMTARQDQKGFTFSTAGQELSVEPGSYVVGPAELDEGVKREFIVISKDGLLQLRLTQKADDAPGGSGEMWKYRAREADGKQFMESIQQVKWEGARRESSTVDFTYTRRDGLAVVKRLDITRSQTVQDRQGPHTSTIKWQATLKSLNIERGEGVEAATDTDAPEGSPQQVAAAILKAYKARDLDAMLPHAAEVNQKIIKELAEQREKHGRWNSLFGTGWRASAVAAWDGKLGAVRYPSGDEAWVAFGKNADGEVLVVALVKETGQWRWMDLNSIETDRFEKAAAAP